MAKRMDNFMDFIEKHPKANWAITALLCTICPLLTIPLAWAFITGTSNVSSNINGVASTSTTKVKNLEPDEDNPNIGTYLN
jgi:hypothetical protein